MSTQTYKSGAFATDTVSDIISLWTGISAGNYSTFRKVGVGAFPPVTTSGSGYQITAGKTFRITRILFASNGIAFNYGRFSLLYGDSDIGFASAAAPVNPIALFGSPGGAWTFSSPIFNSTGENGMYSDLQIVIPSPSGKYICAYGNTGGDSLAVYIEGFEA